MQNSFQNNGEKNVLQAAGVIVVEMSWLIKVAVLR